MNMFRKAIINISIKKLNTILSIHVRIYRPNRVSMRASRHPFYNSNARDRAACRMEMQQIFSYTRVHHQITVAFVVLVVSRFGSRRMCSVESTHLIVRCKQCVVVVVFFWQSITVKRIWFFLLSSFIGLQSVNWLELSILQWRFFSDNDVSIGIIFMFSTTYNLCTNNVCIPWNST